MRPGLGRAQAPIPSADRDATLDYVAAWFLKAGAYVQQSVAGIGFVATNSITQGERVAQLWPLLFDRFRLEIAFAHRTFAWGSDARGKAHQALDAAVDRLYRPQNFAGDRERVEHLFGLYEKLVLPLSPAVSPADRGQRRRAPQALSGSSLSRADRR